MYEFNHQDIHVSCPEKIVSDSVERHTPCVEWRQGVDANRGSLSLLHSPSAARVVSFPDCFGLGTRLLLERV